MDNIVLAWIGTGKCEPGDELYTALAPIVAILVLLVSVVGLWKIYRKSNKNELSTLNRSVNLIMFIVGLGVAVSFAGVTWFLLALSGACSG